MYIASIISQGRFPWIPLQVVSHCDLWGDSLDKGVLTSARGTDISLRFLGILRARSFELISGGSFVCLFIYYSVLCYCAASEVAVHISDF